MNLKNDRLIRALLRQPVDKTPVWIMRQAGRYLPEYRKIRSQVRGFLELCQTPELACEVTLQPLARFDLDAAIIFSDILTIPEAMGLGLEFVEGEGPQFATPMRDLAQIMKLPIPDPEDDLGYVMETIRLTQQALQGKVPVIGFAGSPWTLAAYMVEGRSSREFAIIKQFLYQEPKALHQLLEKLAKSVILYLNAQVKAGANAIMIFDSWGGVLSEAAYLEFSLKYMEMIIAGLIRAPSTPVIVFTKGGGLWLEDIAKIGCDAIGLDWTIDIGKARERVGDRVALQGNLDPAILYANPSVIQCEVKKVLDAFGSHPGHVFNLGHGITPGVNPDHLAVLIEAVHGG